jgi:hypothetical protein
MPKEARTYLHGEKQEKSGPQTHEAIPAERFGCFLFQKTGRRLVLTALLQASKPPSFSSLWDAVTSPN